MKYGYARKSSIQQSLSIQVQALKAAGCGLVRQEQVITLMPATNILPIRRVTFIILLSLVRVQNCFSIPFPAPCSRNR